MKTSLTYVNSDITVTKSPWQLNMYRYSSFTKTQHFKWQISELEYLHNARTENILSHKVIYCEGQMEWHILLTQFEAFIKV